MNEKGITSASGVKKIFLLIFLLIFSFGLLQIRPGLSEFKIFAQTSGEKLKQLVQQSSKIYDTEGLANPEAIRINIELEEVYPKTLECPPPSSFEHDVCKMIPIFVEQTFQNIYSADVCGEDGKNTDRCLVFLQENLCLERDKDKLPVWRKMMEDKGNEVPSVARGSNISVGGDLVGRDKIIGTSIGGDSVGRDKAGGNTDNTSMQAGGDIKDSSVAKPGLLGRFLRWVSGFWK